MFDTEGIVEHLDHGGETVGGTGSVGNNVVLVGIIHIVIHAQDQGQVFAFGGSRYDNFAGAALEVAGCFVGVREYAGGLDHQINAHFRPRYLRRVPFGEDLDAAAVHDQVSVVGFNLSGVAAIAGVILQ